MKQFLNLKENKKRKKRNNKNNWEEQKNCMVVYLNQNYQ